jgi:hypothetical protein
VSETKGRKIALKGLLIALGIICIILASGLVGALAYYVSLVNDKNITISSLNSQISELENQLTSDNSTVASDNATIANLQNQVTGLQTQVNEFLNENDFILKDFILFNDEFGNVSLWFSSYNFSPPVSIYRALRIALESGGWNASSLSDKIALVSLAYTESSSIGIRYKWLYYVTQPAKDYSPVQVNGTTYRYVWSIMIRQNRYPSGVTGIQITPFGFYYVDVSTGEIVLPPPVF